MKCVHEVAGMAAQKVAFDLVSRPARRRGSCRLDPNTMMRVRKDLLAVAELVVDFAASDTEVGALGR
jgi:hypothetical protein